MRLIDADALEKDLRSYADRTHLNGHIELANGILKAINRVEESHTIDASPVVHGRWIDRCSNGWMTQRWRCSQCHAGIMPGSMFIPYDSGFKYCPNCGAKMEGSVKDG